MRKNRQNINLLLFLSWLLSLVGSAKANDTSGACVWWLLFTFAILVGGSAYIFYLVYVIKQPLGKAHRLQEAEGQEVKEEVKEETKENIQKENRRSRHHHNKSNRSDLEKSKQISDKDNTKMDLMIDRRNYHIDENEVKFKIQDGQSRDLNNSNSTEGKGKNNLDQSQPQFFINHQDSGHSSYGAEKQKLHGVVVVKKKIGEDEVEELDEDRSVEELDLRQNEFIPTKKSTYSS